MRFGASRMDNFKPTWTENYKGVKDLVEDFVTNDKAPFKGPGWYQNENGTMLIIKHEEVGFKVFVWNDYDPREFLTEVIELPQHDENCPCDPITV